MNYDNTEKIKSKLEELSKTDLEIARTKLIIILEKLPIEFKNIVNEAFEFKRIPKEYLLSSILFAVSTSVGLTFYINTFGYKNYANLYFTIIGSRGDAKSEAIKIATKPIKEIDDNDYNNYKDDLNGSQFDKDCEPIRKQVIIQNASIEAAHKVHSENPNSIGILIDEIFALVEKMGNSSSRDGVAWRNFLLEGYTNGYVDVSRKTTQSFRISDTCPTLLGGLQHQFVSQLFANGNLESGFIDRLLFTPKLTCNNKLSSGKMSSKCYNDYSKSINNILDYKRQSESPDEEIKQFKISVSEDAEFVLFNYVQELINRQTNAKPMIKEYMSKMQISIHKFCVLVYILKHSANSSFASILTVKDVELAIDLNEFYFINFNIIINDNIKVQSKEPTIDQIIKIAKKNNASQKAVSEITGLHKGTISKKWNKE